MALDSKQPNTVPSTARGYDANNNLIVPGLPEFTRIYLVNRHGFKADIGEMVLGIDIVEDLYSPILKGTLRIHDKINFFQEYQFDGSESVRMLIKVQASQTVINYLDLSFKFVNFSRFEKTAESINVQQYDVELVNYITYASQLSKICRRIKDDPYEQIKLIFKELTKDQGDSKISWKPYVNGNEELQTLSNPHLNVTRLQGNITSRSPLSAIEFLRTKCFDLSFSPFFIYNQLSPDSERAGGSSGDGKGLRKSRENILISSLSDLVEDATNPVYQPEVTTARDAEGLPKAYRYTAGFTSDKSILPGTKEYLDSQILKILSLNSNLNLSYLNTAAQGGFGNQTNIVDYLRKDLLNKQFNPGFDGADSWILKEFRPSEENANDNLIPFTDIKYNGIPISVGGPAGASDGAANNTELFKQAQTTLHLPSSQEPNPEDSGIAVPARTDTRIHNDPPENVDFRTAPEIYANGLNQMNYYYGQLAGRQELQISLHGDLSLNPGKRIFLEIPRSDPQEGDAVVKTAEEQLDMILSGIYLIITAAHKFETGNYVTIVKCIKLKHHPLRTPKGKAYTAKATKNLKKNGWRDGRALYAAP